MNGTLANRGTRHVVGHQPRRAGSLDARRVAFGDPERADEITAAVETPRTPAKASFIADSVTVSLSVAF
jgi:hypothetical protein